MRGRPFSRFGTSNGSKIDSLKIKKYRKTIGGLFKITLLVYSQRGWKGDPETPHFGEVFWVKIDSKSIQDRKKMVLEIITENQLENQCKKWYLKLDIGCILGLSWVPTMAAKGFINRSQCDSVSLTEKKERNERKWRGKGEGIWYIERSQKEGDK